MSNRKSQCALKILISGLLVFCLFIIGCEPESEADGQGNSAGQSTAESVVPRQAGQQRDNQAISAAVEQVSGKIIGGQFDAAGEILATLPDAEDTRLDALSAIVDQYRALQAERQAAKQKVLQEQLDELDKLRVKFESVKPSDVNDFGSILAVVAGAAEYSDSQQKRRLLEDDFVKSAIDMAQQRADEFEKQGRWADAYAACYFWLRIVFKDNADYKAKAETLADKVTIEMLLQRDNCDRAEYDRYRGIDSEMLERSIKVLDLNYVSLVDYAGMAQKALDRCILLSQVLVDSPRELIYRVDPNTVKPWSEGIRQLAATVADSKRALTKDRFLKIFEDALALNAVTISLPDEVVIAHFSEAALEAMDPFTAIIWPQQMEEFQKNMTLQFSGIGVEISKDVGVLRVVSLLPNTPAYISGLDANDEIVAVDGEATKDITIFCAVSKITGPKGTQVTLTVRHPGSDETEDITITRGDIVVHPLRGWQRDQSGRWKYMIDPVNGIGYIRLSAFTENTASEMALALEELEQQGLKGLVLDIRFNSGGYLTSAAEIVDIFIEEGLIVRSQPRGAFGTSEFAHREGTHPDYPLAVIINESSASASEIVAGALQDAKYKRAVIVGERSYGKGSVQVVVPYTGGGSQLKYTVAYYHLPSGQRVENRYMMERQQREDWGIKPDVEVKLTAREWRKVIDVQRANEVLARVDHADSNPIKRYQFDEILSFDPQLAVAVMIIKAEIIRRGDMVIPAPAADESSEEAVVAEK